MKKEEVRKLMIEKALKDHSFIKKLMANPNQAMKQLIKENGISSKNLEEMNFKVYSEKKNEMMIVLPAELSEVQISDENLKGLVGGWGGNCNIDG